MRFVPILAALVLAAPAWAQTQIYQQSFEDGTGYSQSASCNDGFTDFFTRTDLSDVSTDYQITGIDGSYIFAAQDIDAEPDSGCDGVPQTVTITGIDISGYTDLEFRGLFAEDAANDAANDWDEPDFVHVNASIDGGEPIFLVWFENDGSTFNGPALEDTDYDFTGDGAALTPTLTEFIKAIAGTGSTLDLTITFSLDSGDEDIAIDNFRIYGTADVAENSDPTSDTVMDGDAFDVEVDETYSATYSFSDADAADVVSVAVTNAPANFTATPTDGNPATVDVCFTPEASQANQSYDVTFTATDGNGGSAEVTVTYNVGDAPPPPGGCDYAFGAISQNATTLSSDGGMLSSCSRSTTPPARAPRRSTSGASSWTVRATPPSSAPRGRRACLRARSTGRATTSACRAPSPTGRTRTRSTRARSTPRTPRRRRCAARSPSR